MLEGVVVEDFREVAVESVKVLLPDGCIGWAFAEEVFHCFFFLFAAGTDVSVAKSHLGELVVESYMASDELDKCSVVFSVVLVVFELCDDSVMGLLILRSYAEFCVLLAFSEPVSLICCFDFEVDSIFVSGLWDVAIGLIVRCCS